MAGCFEIWFVSQKCKKASTAFESMESRLGAGLAAIWQIRETSLPQQGSPASRRRLGFLVDGVSVWPSASRCEAKHFIVGRQSDPETGANSPDLDCNTLPLSCGPRGFGFLTSRWWNGYTVHSDMPRRDDNRVAAARTSLSGTPCIERPSTPNYTFGTRAEIM